MKDGTVLANDEVYHLPVRGVDDEGYPEVLINAKAVGGDGMFYRQSVKPYIGMVVQFQLYTGTTEGINYIIINKEKIWKDI